MCTFKYNDGGRSNYFEGMNARDCVTRAIAIATGSDYKEIYDLMARANKAKGGSRSARNGISRKVYDKYLLANGFRWIATMKFGQGCTVHLIEDELPKGIIIARLSRHITCVIDGVINDTFNPRRGGSVGTKNGIPFNQKETRCVYGYYLKVK